MNEAKKSADTGSGRQAGASLGGYKGRGVYVPDGMSASEIMAGALALEREFDVAPFVSRLMARRVLQAAQDEDVKPE